MINRFDCTVVQEVPSLRLLSRTRIIAIMSERQAKMITTYLNKLYEAKDIKVKAVVNEYGMSHVLTRRK